MIQIVVDGSCVLSIASIALILLKLNVYICYSDSLSRSRQSSRPSTGTIPPPVAPPTVPSHYMSALQLQAQQAQQAQQTPQANLNNPTYGE